MRMFEREFELLIKHHPISNVETMTQKSNFFKKEESSSYRPNIQRDTFLEGSTNDNREFLP